MSIRAIFIIALALICGISAAWGVNQFRKPTEVAVQPETAPVLVAARDMPRGQLVTGSDVRVCQWLKEMVPPGVLTKADDAEARSAMVPIMAGEPILEGKLAKKEAGRGLAALILPGMRAYTVQTARAATNVAGFVCPGNRVDVLLNLKNTGQNDETGGGSTTTLLQAVEILATNQDLEPSAQNKTPSKDLSSVTLLVTPHQAALLDLGQNLGTLSLALRNAEDSKEALTQPATLADIRFRQEKPGAKPGEGQAESKTAQPEVFWVTIRGSQRDQVLVASRKGSK